MIFLIIALLSTLFPDIYIWYNFIAGRGLIVSLLFFMPTIVTLIALALGMNGVHPNAMLRLFITLILSFGMPKLLFSIVNIVGKLAALGLPTAYHYFNFFGIVIGVVFFIIALVGFTYGWKHISVNHQTMPFLDVPESFDGYRIVQLSDMHIGTYQYAPQVVEQLVDKVNELNPDVILFTGDLVNMSPEEVAPFMSVLGRLKARDGIYSIMGNHDYCIYGSYKGAERVKAVQRVREIEKELGWKMLVNEHVLIHHGKDSIAIIGVENSGTPPFPDYSDLPKAMKGLDNNTFKILMTHDPSHWRREVLNTDIQLTLSGHTHAMQFRIGNFSPSKYTYREWGGVYEQSGRLLNVSTGCGSNVPFRFGAWPEIMLIELKRR